MRRNKISIYLHLVWKTKNALPLIKPAIENDLYRYIKAVCLDQQCDVLAIGGMPDHVHLLITFHCTLSIAELMKRIKGGSSRFAAEKLLPEEEFGWQANYGVFSVSPHDKERVI